MIYIVWVLVIVILFVMILVSFEPMHIYEEQDKFKENPFDIKVAAYTKYEDAASLCVGVDVKNRTKVTIKDCQLWLTKIKYPQNNNISIPINPPILLGWNTANQGSIQEPIREMNIGFNRSWSCDIAMTMPGQHKAAFRVPERLEGLSPFVFSHGEYQATIRIDGNWKKEDISYYFEIFLEFNSDTSLKILDIKPIPKKTP